MCTVNSQVFTWLCSRRSLSCMMLLPPSLVRLGLLTILTIQNTVTILCIRYSRLHPNRNDESDLIEPNKEFDSILDDEPSTYFVSSLVFAVEAIKLSFVFVLLITVQMRCSLKKTIDLIYTDVICRPADTLRLSIPSILYVMQDNLIVFALSCLDAGTYQVTYQGRILTTAIFAWILLNKHLTPRHWSALFLLMFGVILTQVDLSGGSIEFRSETGVSYYLGLLAVCLATMTSGFAGVYNEKLLKDGQQPLLLVRSLQLSIFCVSFALLGALFKDWNLIVKYGFFYGFSPFILFTASLQATGGILVAATMKFADNILKTFATSISIVLSCFLSFLLLGDLKLTSSFIAGTVIILTATYLYSRASEQTKASNSLTSLSQFNEAKESNNATGQNTVIAPKGIVYGV